MLKIFGYYIPKAILLLGSTENLILLFSAYLSINLGIAMGIPVSGTILWQNGALFCIVMLVVMAAMGMYQRESVGTCYSKSEDNIGLLVARILLSFLIGGCLLIVIYTLIPHLFIGRNVFLFAMVSSFVGILWCRLIWRFRTEKLLLRTDKLLKQQTLVIGAGKKAHQLESLRNVNESGIKIIGFIDIEKNGNRQVDDEYILDIDSDLSNLKSIVQDNNIKEIVIALDERRKTIPIENILDCKMQGVRVIDINSFLERQLGKICVSTLQPSGLIYSDGFIQNQTKSFCKRVFDIVISICIFLIALPIILLTILAILVESNWKGSVLYRQERIGRGNIPFYIYKFRSMKEDAEKSGNAIWASKDDSRVTFVGKFIRKTHIDELPQIFNVIRGDMSFVGPRPERPQFVEELNTEIPFYSLRHHIKPGITGWAQICYPYCASINDAKEKLQYDLYYLKNNTIFMDLLILLQTAAVIISCKGAR